MFAAEPETAFDDATLPYGVFSPPGGEPRIGTRLADRVIDLAAIARESGNDLADALEGPSLNALMSGGPRRWRAARAWVREVVAAGAGSSHEWALDDVQLHLPIEVADYVDFYASEVHASNVGKIFRPDSPDLPPNWKHLPIGYHGRAGTVVVSGTEITRPTGQRRPGPDGVPPFGPSARLDIECEVGFVIGTPTDLGVSVSVADAADHIFGVVLVNDWSARDIQAWEYVPLGPFLGKSFATSVSPWVVPLEALGQARTAIPQQVPAVLPYLAGDASQLFGLDLRLTVTVNGQVISRPEYRDMYWSPAQMLAHLTVNGASLRVGDLFASGTVSGRTPDMFGSLLERTWNGNEPVALPGGRELGFLEDGDTVTISGWAAGADGSRVSLGEVSGTVVAGR